jgi:hypothetical protein
MSADHATLLPESLHRLAALEHSQSLSNGGHNPEVVPHLNDDYGFRKSDISSLHLPAEPNNPGSVCDMANVVPDLNGLGWPGKSIP